MKHVSRGLAAGAAGLLLSAGVASPASAAPADCQIRINDPAPVSEGDAEPTVGAFVVTATATNGTDPCNGASITYTFGGTAASGSDFTGTDGTLTFGSGANKSVQSQEIPFSVLGDDADEEDETITITLTTTTGQTLSDATGTTTIVDDDDAGMTPAPGIGEGGALTITPAAGPAGTEITASGTECEAATASVVLGSSDGGSGGPVESTRQSATVTDGDFTAKIVVPADADPALIYSVQATCGEDSYTGQAFDVTPAATGGGTGGDGTDVGNGYRMVAADGGIFTFGDRRFHGSTGDIRLNQPIVGGATDISDYEGYWIVARDGGVFAFDAEFHGSLVGQALSAAVAEIEPTPTGEGYWIVLADGKVYPFGDAEHFGDMSGRGLNKPIVGVSVTPTGEGYWLVAEDGGIFNFGDAEFFGSMGDRRLNAPVIDLAPAVDNNGYYLLGSDGGVFTFGSAEFRGSTGDIRLNKPVVAMLTTPTGSGYWLAASDGGIFAFGPGAEFLGSMGGTPLTSPVLDLIN